MKTIFKAKTGSHLFGTSTPTSDTDIKGVYIPSAKEILLPNIPGHKSFSTGSDKVKNTSDDTDEEYYALHKFMDMLAKGDMVATEMLFAKNEVADNRIWCDVVGNERVVSRECKGFVGYVQRQANTYSVKGDRLNELVSVIDFLKSLERDNTNCKKLSDVEGFRTIAAEYVKHLKHAFVETVMINGKEVFHLVCCDRKVPDSVTFKNALEVYERVERDYGNRARMAASANGHDWKALSHAVRVGEEAKELLSTGKITFPRPNKEFLLDIKLGNVEYLKVADILEELLGDVEKMVENSVLPEKPDHKWIQEFIEDVYSNEVLNYYSYKL